MNNTNTALIISIINCIIYIILAESTGIEPEARNGSICLANSSHHHQGLLSIFGGRRRARSPNPLRFYQFSRLDADHLDNHLPFILFNLSNCCLYRCFRARSKALEFPDCSLNSNWKISFSNC